MKVREIEAKSILSKSKVFDWTINSYVGCQHNCTYCYARFMKKFTGHSEKWGDFVDVKINASELLEKEIKRKKKGKVWISGVCDPYQEIEKRYRITRRCLEILQRYDWPVVIQTKSPLVQEDLSLFKKFNWIEVGLTITTGNEEIRRIFEPNAASIRERIEALNRTHQEGIRTYAMIAPILPGAEDLGIMLKGKIDYALIDRENYHYADWVYKKYHLQKVRDANGLVNFFRMSHIPIEVLF